MIDDPLVEALEARREHHELALGGQLLHERLVELAPLRRQRDDPRRLGVTVGRVERCRDDVDPQHHPRPTAVRRVVDLARPQRRRVAVVEQAQLQLTTEHVRDRSMLRHPREGMRDLREDVDAHSGPG